MSNNEREFWYGRINKHPEDCSREEIFRIMAAFGENRVKVEQQRILGITEEMKRLSHYQDEDLKTPVYFVDFKELIEKIKG